LPRRIPCVALLAVFAAIGAVFLFSAAPLPAGVTGSPHDFSTGTGPYTQSASIAPSGNCSACHIPHGADSYGIWARDLTAYRTKLGMNGSISSEPNYVHAPTIQCYDCHDSHDDTSNRIDAVPLKNDFSSSHYPQNIAFGFTKTGLGSMTEDPVAGAVPGYYENKPPYASSPSSYYGADPALNPSDNAQLLKTGGHYFKYVDPDGGTATFKKGDKLPCRDCHDPHAWDTQWQAFFRKSWPTSIVSSRLGSTVAASAGMANNAGTRDTLNGGRKLCTACHGTSDGTPVNFSDISAQYTASGAIVKPPTTISEHASANTTTPCVSCHNHNSVDVSCGECHGFPPPHYPPGKNPDNVVKYAVTPEVTHAVHFGKQNGSGAAYSKYAFQCNVCHANSAMGTKTPSNHVNDNVDVDFDLAALATTRAWIDTVPSGHPTRFQPFTGSAYTRTTCGPTGRGGIYCHSDGHDNTAAVGYYKNVTWGTASLACSGCHGNPAYAASDIRYGMPDKTDHPNTHERHVVGNGYECSVCHFNTATGTYLAGSRAIKGTTNAYHVNGSMDVFFDPASATGSYIFATKTCSVSCHGSDAPVWGTTLSGGCLACHSGTEQIHKPRDDYGTAGTPNPVDSAEYVYSGHGRSGSNYPVSNNLPAGFSNYTTAPVACYVCHSQAASHTTKSANDPFRLGSSTDGTLGGIGNWTGAWADNTDLLCLGCHGNAGQRSGHDNAAKGTTTIEAQTHARGITGSKYNWPGSNYPWKCVDCHDPHGDGKSGAERLMMIRSGINAPIDNTDSNAGSDAKSRTKRTDANVLPVTFNSIAGYAAGSYAAPGNGPTWGPCEVCHTQTTAYGRTKDNLASHASRTNRCTTCHPHKAGFAPTACKGCHGPDSVATAARAPEVGQYWSSSGHGKFTTGSPSRAIECEDCHDTGYLTSSDHKTDGSVAGNPPNNVNTLGWPGKTPLDANTNPNANTSHLKSGYINTSPSTRADVARTFDTYCVTTCHAADYHRHWKPTGAAPQDVMRFGDPGTSTTSNPKQYNWMTIGTYATDFYRTQGVWIDSDFRVSGLGDTANYGLCVSCHDPHGTGVTDTSGYPGLGITNHMLRGNWVTDAGTFCGRACHTSRAAP
jgi:predicted CxxxxCH...CXXCH cytochrome family protein